MTSGIRSQGSGTWMLAMLAALALAPSAWAQGKGAAKPDAYDFVFMAEDRPVLLRVHVRIDGKTLDDAGLDFVRFVFEHLDRKGRGYLMQTEVERLPSLSHMQMGGLASPFGGFGGGTPKDAEVKMADVDANKDGKVTLTELAAYYRSKGFVPIQVHSDANKRDNYMAMMAMDTGVAPDPGVEAIRSAVFSLFDVKKTGKITRGDLLQAEKILLRHDENDDEMITTRELPVSVAPRFKYPPIEMKKSDKTAPKVMPKEAPPPKANSKENKPPAKDMPKKEMPKRPIDGPSTITPLTNPRDAMLVMVATPITPEEIAQSILRRYLGPDSKDKEIRREKLGLDDATFKLLDVNGDGLLDAKELAAFVTRRPDLEIMVRLADPGDAHRGVELLKPNGTPANLEKHANMFDGLAMIELVKTRFELRGEEEIAKDTYGPFLRLQYSVIFTQLDKDNDGYIDAAEVGGNQFGMGGLFSGVFKAMDADGDGRVSKQEFDAYLDFLGDAKVRLARGCVSLALTNESRGLFDLLDTNRDGRLSVRELRGGSAIFDRLDRNRKGFVTEADIPSSYRLTVRRGPAGINTDDYTNLLASLYGGSAKTERVRTLTNGPLWFRKMDKNRDGDVSRKEWLGADELFRQIDSDGDGLISAAAAERFDRLHRKGK